MPGFQLLETAVGRRHKLRQGRFQARLPVPQAGLAGLQTGLPGFQVGNFRGLLGKAVVGGLHKIGDQPGQVQQILAQQHGADSIPPLGLFVEDAGEVRDVGHRGSHSVIIIP